MKIRSLFAAAGLLVAASHPLHAQASSPLALTLFGGAVLPSGDNSSNMNAGYTFGLAGDVRVPLTPFGIRVEGMRARSTSKVSSSGFSAIMGEYGVNANGVLWISTPLRLIFSPYVTGGASYSRLSADTKQGEVIKFGTKSNEMGFNAGGGVEFSILDVGLRADVRYKRISSPGGNYATIPITIGLRF